jgi:hypothetical protein
MGILQWVTLFYINLLAVCPEFFILSAAFGNHESVIGFDRGKKIYKKTKIRLRGKQTVSKLLSSADWVDVERYFF